MNKDNIQRNIIGSVLFFGFVGLTTLGTISVKNTIEDNHLPEKIAYADFIKFNVVNMNKSNDKRISIVANSSTLGDIEFPVTDDCKFSNNLNDLSYNPYGNQALYLYYRKGHSLHIDDCMLIKRHP